MSQGLHMRYRRERRAPEEYGRFANLGLLTVVLLLAALWLAFPPVQLSLPLPLASPAYAPSQRALPLPLAGEGAPHVVRGG